MKKLPNFSNSVLLFCCAALFLAFVPDAKPKFKDLWKPIGDNVYASVTETSVLDFREFLYHLEKNQQPYTRYKIDTTVWKRHHQSFHKFAKDYIDHPAFLNYPVVGVSHEGAKAYCEWLTEVVNENPKREFEKVLYRLPTEAEWEKAAAADLEEPLFPWQLPPGREVRQWTLDKKGEYRCNFKIIDQAFIQKDPETGKSIIVDSGVNLGGDMYMLTAPVKSYEPNPWGLYNMAGNVAEMIDEPGIAKGGSWYSTGYYLRIKSQETYDKPLSNVGFRVFMEVIE